MFHMATQMQIQHPACRPTIKPEHWGVQGGEGGFWSGAGYNMGGFLLGWGGKRFVSAPNCLLVVIICVSWSWYIYIYIYIYNL